MNYTVIQYICISVVNWLELKVDVKGVNICTKDETENSYVERYNDFFDVGSWII